MPSLPPALSLVDEEILFQFVQALHSDSIALALLGPTERTYAVGVSQTAAALMDTLYNFGSKDLFDLTLLHIALW